MYLKSSKTKPAWPVLHVTVAGFVFNAASLSPALDNNTVWDTFLKASSTVYVRYSESMLTDQESVSLSEEWEYNCDEGQIHLTFAGTESHNSLGIEERYYCTLRKLNSKVIRDKPHLPDDLAPAKSAQAMNEKTGPHGLVPSLLVIRVLPKLPKISPQGFPRQKERLRAAQAAR